MSRRCEMCGKSTIFGNTVSHAKNRTRRTWYPNLVSLRTMVDGTVLSIKICMRCLKANKIVKVV
jgi:large subunit ribosomal protein L28